ncbi:tetratricopeptide repeat protein [Saccharopolyspora rhizosphaerae]|uniref:Tetratricopeptide repeat protein n=1 Tax=Saccharopolyspora rhizosphaerae TaxID=2492662 RepID=A0A426JY26_9PSEU|nr:tetratricopeptide repeat protein [Saccharopolyspora rhizosphaerae]RRO17961.1 tetratricopeptide repeat protein [Saccharopolyspora rhizosphaerae]
MTGGGSPVHQEVRVESGFGYGVVGADLHVFADRGPVYVLEEFRPPAEPDPEWLVEMPSRMLNARHKVVEFTGRADELDRLREWRDAGPRMAARWLHAPGGQGKTRLASRFAADSLAEGWKVVTATHGPGTVLPPPGSQDLRTTGRTGLLLLVDYADRWPLTHLTWLLSNAVLHQSAVPARVLLLARSADAWPAVRAALANHQAGTSTQRLPDLPDDTGQRAEMFHAARDGFARRYGVEGAARIEPPGPLEDPDFGLTLAVHVAALVAVDAHVAGRRPPADMANLTTYLLDREHLHWTNLFENRGVRTPPAVMNRTVFTASLTGPGPRAPAKVVLRSLGLEAPAEQVLDDHALCYPPAAPADSAMEPLYPDRLAEDFLALTLPGHTADYPAQSWAAPTTATLLTDAGTERLARGMTFLAAAAQRWPHVGPDHLYPLLRASPRTAVDAGGAVLSALADLDDVEPDLLEAVAAHIPESRRADLDVGTAAITVRLAPHRLRRATGPVEEFEVHTEVGRRLSHAGRHQQELGAREQAVAAARRVDAAATGRQRIVADLVLAKALRELSRSLHELQREGDALDAAVEAVAAARRLAGAAPGRFDAELAHTVYVHAKTLSHLGRRREALETLQESVELFRRLAQRDRRYERDFAVRLTALGASLTDAARLPEAVEVSLQAVSTMRRLVAENPAENEIDFAELLLHCGNRLSQAGRGGEAVEIAGEAVEAYRRLARRNPAAFEPLLARALQSQAPCLAGTGRVPEALAALEEAVAVLTRVTRTAPAAYEPKRIEASLVLAAFLAFGGQLERARAIQREQLAAYRKLVQAAPDVHEHTFMVLLLSLASQNADLPGEIDRALEVLEEALALSRRRPGEVPVIVQGMFREAGRTVADRLEQHGRAPEAVELRATIAALPGLPDTTRPRP